MNATCEMVMVELLQCVQNSLILLTLTPQTAICGILDSLSDDSTNKNKVFINNNLLVIKLYVSSKSRGKSSYI